MATTVLNIKIDATVKNKAQKIAAELGFTLSGIVNVYLRQFIRTKSLSVSLRNEEASAHLLSALRATKK